MIEKDSLELVKNSRLKLANSYRLGGNKLGRGALGGFDPSLITVLGEKTLAQQLLVKQAPTIDGVIYDESKNKGDARPEQLRQFRNLNGTTQYGTIPDNTDLDITDNLSVIVWAKNDSSASTTVQSMFSKWESNPGNKREWALAFDASEKLYFICSGDGTVPAQYTSNDSFTLNSVRSYGVTFDGGVTKLYVNGVEIAGSVTLGIMPTSLFNGDSVLTFGMVNIASPSALWDGDVYEGRIYKNQILTAAEILDIHTRPTTHTPVVATLAAHYKLDNNTTDVIWDSSGNGNHGTWINSPTKSTGGAVHSWPNDQGFSQFTYFNGVDKRVDYAVPFPIQGATDFSVRVKINSNSIVGTQAILEGRDANDDGFRLSLSSAQILLGHNAVDYDTTDNPITKNEDYTIVFSCDHDGVKQLWINGELKKSDSAVLTALATTTNFKIGRIAYTDAWYFDGNLPYVEIYDEALSAAESQSASNDQIITTQPIHRWEFTNNTNASIEDKIGSIDGTYVGSPALIYIPRDESNTENTIFGNPLQFRGRVPYNAKAEQSNCLALNGTSQYANFGDITALEFGTDNFEIETYIESTDINATICAKYSVTSDQRESRLEIDNLGRFATIFSTDGVATVRTQSTFTVNDGLPHKLKIVKSGTSITYYKDDVAYNTETVPANIFGGTAQFLVGALDALSPSLFFAGKIYGLRILHSGEEIFNAAFADGVGIIAHEKYGNHGTLVNAPTWAKQDTYHSNLVNGCSRYAYLNDPMNSYVTFTQSLATATNATVRFKIQTKDSDGLILRNLAASSAYLMAWSQSLTPTNTTISANAGTPSYTIDEILFTGTTRGELHAIIADGNIHDVVITNVNLSSWTGTMLGYFTDGNAFNLQGVVFDLSIEKVAGTVDHRYEGYGNTTANWVDKVGSADGTIIGTLTDIYIPAVSSTLDAFRETLKNPAGAHHPGVETLIDFTNNVLSPEAVRNSWETAWAFNTTRVNPEFKRTLTKDGVAHRADRFLAYRNALSGSNLTKVEKYTLTKAI